MKLYSTTLPFFLLFMMSIVISREEIQQALPVGSSEEDATIYLREIAGDFEFVTRENDKVLVPPYPWLESEIGHYLAGIEGVKSRWWLPSFGRVLVIRIGISSDRTVTQVDITGSRVGFP